MGNTLHSKTGSLYTVYALDVKLNCCIHISSVYRRRHIAIVNRIEKAASARWAIEGEDQIVGGANHRTDQILRKTNEIIINDVTVPFENGSDAFQIVS